MAKSSKPDSANAAAVSARWVTWREQINIDDYDRRFESSAASGENVHGEADLIASYAPTSILDAGCGTGRIAIELNRRGLDVSGVDLDVDMIEAARRKAPEMHWIVDDLARMQLSRQYPMIIMPGNVMIFCQPHDRLLIVHNMAQHLEPGGLLIAGFSLEPGGYTLGDWDEHCRACGLDLVERFSGWDRAPFFEGGSYHVSVHSRSPRFTVHDLVAEARRGLDRLACEELREALTAGDDLVVCDTRQTDDWNAHGYIEGSVHIPRSVLEWRADPISGFAHPEIAGFDKRIVIVCNDGYSSSLAAATLQRLGYGSATDLIGGFQAWLRAGFPTVGGSGVR